MFTHYVEYLVHDSYEKGGSFKCISQRLLNPGDFYVDLTRLPRNFYGYRFYDRSSTGHRENESDWYFVGERMNVEQVKEMYGKDSRYAKIIERMLAPLQPHEVVRTRTGVLIPFHNYDRMAR